MAVNKVVVNGETKIDLTSDTVTADKILSGFTAHAADGGSITGSLNSVGDLDVYSDYDIN